MTSLPNAKSNTCRYYLTIPTSNLQGSKKPNHLQLFQGNSDDTDVRDILAKASLLFNNGVLNIFFQTISYLHNDKKIKEYENIEP